MFHGVDDLANRASPSMPSIRGFLVAQVACSAEPRDGDGSGTTTSSKSKLPRSGCHPSTRLKPPMTSDPVSMPSAALLAAGIVGVDRERKSTKISARPSYSSSELAGESPLHCIVGDHAAMGQNARRAVAVVPRRSSTWSRSRASPHNSHQERPSKNSTAHARQCSRSRRDP